MARIGELIGPNGEVMHPKTFAEVVYLEDGRTVEQVLSDDIDYGNVVFQDNSYKFSSDVEDDFAKTVIIKGQTYQNILPEPSTHVLTNNKEMFKVNEGLDPNVEIVDGVSKSAILSGSTKYQIGEFIQDVYVPVQKFKAGFYLNWETGVLTSGGDSHKYCEDYILIPSGVSSITSTGSNNWKKLCCYDSNKQFIAGANGTVGVEDLTLKIPSNAKYFRYSTNTAQGENEYVNVVSDTGLLLASSNYNIPCELISCKMPVLKTTGKNLCDTSKYIHGGPSTDRKMIFSKDKYRSYYMKCKPSTVYTVKVENSNNRFGVASSHLFSEDTEFELNMCWFTSSSDVTGQTLQYTATTTEKDEYLYVYVANNGVFNPDIRVQVEEGSVATAFEPYRTNILSTPEEVVLRGFDSVKDTLNLNTGEYVKRIGELTLNGSEYWQYANNTDGTIRFNLPISDFKNYDTSSNGKNLINDKLPKAYFSIAGNTYGVTTWCNHVVFFTEHTNVNDFKQWLSQNPTTIQYELATPVIKTLDLSSSGNWEKIVLNGSESWNGFDPNYGCAYTGLTGKAYGFSNVFAEGFSTVSNYANAPLTISGTPNNSAIWLSIGKSIATLDQFKHYLSQNPITVWYQTTNHKDSTQVKQPIFFKDGHIIQSSGADHSLIPTLDYQAKTSNSYVMDLMKTNTRYTMKAKSASGTFTIDGTSYGAGTNGTFTTPSSMTNKLLVMSNKTNEEVMILEGDVVSKTIPYFKGIKSAFEDESQIEVLSTNSNTWDGVWKEGYELTIGSGVEVAKQIMSCSHFINVVPLTVFEHNDTQNQIRFFMYDKNKQYIKDVKAPTITTTENTHYIRLHTNTNYTKGFMFKPISSPSYEPHKSNSTKIPLLSPLRSLPNGVRDEVIIDMENHKAKIIQRVGETTLNGSENWDSYGDVEGYYAMQTRLTNCKGAWDTCYSLCDKLRYNAGSVYYKSGKAYTLGAENDVPNAIYVCLPKSELTSPDAKGFKQWMRDNTPVVTYRLATPVITEVDLEGFPYIYKDGHIFLNGEITPTVGIEYSINQGHRISSQVETLQRHEQQFTKLERYFADLVHSDYNFALLRFSEKLHQQEGDV